MATLSNLLFKGARAPLGPFNRRYDRIPACPINPHIMRCIHVKSGGCCGRPRKRCRKWKMIEPAREKFTRRDPHLAKYTGLVQANPFEEHGQRYSPARNRRSINEMAPWVHAGRPFFAITDLDENVQRKAVGKEGPFLHHDGNRAPNWRAVRE